MQTRTHAPRAGKSNEISQKTNRPKGKAENPTGGRSNDPQESAGTVNGKEKARTRISEAISSPVKQ